jgi:hypothetical protein
VAFSKICRRKLSNADAFGARAEIKYELTNAVGADDFEEQIYDALDNGLEFHANDLSLKQSSRSKTVPLKRGGGL